VQGRSPRIGRAGQHRSTKEEAGGERQQYRESHTPAAGVYDMCLFNRVNGTKSPPNFHTADALRQAGHGGQNAGITSQQERNKGVLERDYAALGPTCWGELRYHEK